MRTGPLLHSSGNGLSSDSNNLSATGIASQGQFGSQDPTSVTNTGRYISWATGPTGPPGPPTPRPASATASLVGVSSPWHTGVPTPGPVSLPVVGTSSPWSTGIPAPVPASTTASMAGAPSRWSTSPGPTSVTTSLPMVGATNTVPTSLSDFLGLQGSQFGFQSFEVPSNGPQFSGPSSQPQPPSNNTAHSPSPWSHGTPTPGTTSTAPYRHHSHGSFSASASRGFTPSSQSAPASTVSRASSRPRSVGPVHHTSTSHARSSADSPRLSTASSTHSNHSRSGTSFGHHSTTPEPFAAQTGAVSSIPLVGHEQPFVLQSVESGPDFPIPSIERYPETFTAPAPAISRSPRYTPSISLTPSQSPPRRPSSQSSTSGGYTPSVSTQHENETGGILDGLGHVRLSDSLRQNSPFNMDELARSVENVMVMPPGRSSFLSPTPEPRTSGAGRRRSSSRLNSDPPYDVRNEQLPEDRFNNPAVQEAFVKAKELMGDLASVLGSGTLHLESSTSVNSLHRRARELSQFQCPPTHTVGFVGDSGVGKSSLLNTLLDMDELSNSGGGGTACTCVPTEYRYHDKDDFAVKVEQFSREEFEGQLTELVRSYRYFHLCKLQEQEKQGCEKKENLARDTFQSIFRGEPINYEFLLNLSEGDAIGTMIAKASQRWPRDISETLISPDAPETSKILMNLTSERLSSRDPPIWPFIKKVSVYLKAHILSKGLILVDLPGLRDSNTARQNITQRQMLLCDEIFVVCNIIRAVSDEGVKVVFERARQAKLSKVSIVCTKSDDIQASEARGDLTDEDAMRLGELTDTRTNAEERLADLKAEARDYDDYDSLDEDEKDWLNSLGKETRDQEDLIERCKFEELRLLITIRNAEVTAKLVGMYSGKISKDPVPVFCVSNRIYWAHRGKPKPRSKALPFLKLSGGIDLRRYCMSIVCERQHRIVTTFVEHDVPALLIDAELWIESGAATRDQEQKQAVQNTLDRLEAQLRTELVGITSLPSTLRWSFQNEFDTTVYNRSRPLEWLRGAQSASTVWSGWHWGTYAAFCRHFGEYKTGVQPYCNWNEQAIGAMANDLEGPWESFQATLRMLLESFGSLITQNFQWAGDLLAAELDGQSPVAQILKHALTSRHFLLISDLHNIRSKFDSSLRILRAQTLSGIQTSIFCDLMWESYDRCNREKETGSDKRRKAIIKDKFSQEMIFTSLLLEARRRFEALAISLQDEIGKTVSEHLRKVKETLDTIRSENVAVESWRDPEFRARVQRKLQATRDEMRRISDISGK